VSTFITLNVTNVSSRWNKRIVERMEAISRTKRQIIVLLMNLSIAAD